MFGRASEQHLQHQASASGNSDSFQQNSSSSPRGRQFADFIGCAWLFQHGWPWTGASIGYCALGTLQAYWSFLRLHWSGFAVGLVAMLIGIVLFCVALGARNRALSHQGSESPTSVMYAKLETEPRSCRRCWQETLAFFGSSATLSAARSIRWLLWLYATYIALLLLIRLASPDVAFTTFPAECPHEHLESCSRIASTKPWNARKEVPLTVRTPQPALLLAAQVWISHQPYSSFVNVTTDLAHARFVSPFWGFTDDFLVQVRCNRTVGTATMEVQSMSQLGRYDFGVNTQRTMAFMYTMHAKVRKGIFPDKPCYSEN
ncbi:hypothetical protein WJX74_001720 [Apatococcus lobatus]|uniref:Uncharacterized protein n=1 Tax=Apatococcus lobatus TaxID=904363 RepID=A0AAW1QU23_9CHLO